MDNYDPALDRKVLKKYPPFLSLTLDETEYFARASGTSIM